ncbi:MAG: hypothetical protein K1X29_07175 [Bdellovibrionales bacterium]|nr:hypothetical protein [Bdellovibrionales bacterium]
MLGDEGQFQVAGVSFLQFIYGHRILEEALLRRMSLFVGILILFTPFSFGKNLTESTLGLNYSQYIRAGELYYREGAAHSTQSLQLGLRSEVQRKSFFGRLHFRDDFQAQEDFHYVKPFESDVGWHKGTLKISAGRTLFSWSEMDDLWRLGLWQPRFMDDKINREPAGLVGLFIQDRFQIFDVVLMVTPLFIPEIGPHFNESNGAVVSRNPWFHEPTSEINMEGTIYPLKYNIQQPSVGELIQHGSILGKIKWNGDGKTFFQLSAGLKPMNQLFLGLPINKQQRDLSLAQSYVEALPHTRLLYHQLWSVEGGLKSRGPWTLWGSLTRETPLRDQTPEGWITQETGPAWVGSLHLGYRAGEGSLAPEFFINYLKLSGGDLPDRGPFVSEESFFERRYLFQEALQLGWKGLLPGKLSSLRFSSSLLWEQAQHGVLFRNELSQMVQKKIYVQLYADLIGLVDKSGSVTNGFTSLYRANDRVGTQLSYSF